MGDVHLAARSREAVGAALSELIRRHPEHEVILNGDSFDLSTDPPETPASDSVSRLMSTHAGVTEAIRHHLARGARLTFVVGNHDAALASAPVQAALRSAVGTDTARLGFAPWLVRRGGVHVEHGHLYDPDNAPTHPLAPWTLKTEPLGIALMRRFVAPSAMWEFAHGEETTPLAGLLRTFRTQKLRAPGKVFHYYRTAAALTREAGRQPGIDGERASGARAVSAYAEEVGVAPDALHALATASAVATHHRRGATFQRLYLDRSLATALLVAALGASAVGGGAGPGVAAVAASYLGFSVSRGTNRYRGLLETRLAEAATRIRGLTGAAQVVLGHSHRLALSDGYANPGSFAYPGQGPRRFVLVDPDGTTHLGEL